MVFPYNLVFSEREEGGMLALAAIRIFTLDDKAQSERT